MWKCPNCGIISPGNSCRYCNQLPADEKPLETAAKPVSVSEGVTAQKPLETAAKPVWSSQGAVVERPVEPAAEPVPPSGGAAPWRTAARVWMIFKLGSAGLLMLALAVIFALTMDLQIAMYPSLGFLICAITLAVFFWRWRREPPKS